MKLKYTGPHDAVSVGNAELVRDGESVDINDIGITDEQAKALVDGGDFTSGTYKAKVDSDLIPAEDFIPPVVADDPAPAEKE